MFSTSTPTPSKTEALEGEPKAFVQGVFWMRMKENYHTSLDTFSIPRASLIVFITYVIPTLIAGAATCIPLEPAFEGRAANPTFLRVVYPLQQFLRCAGALGISLAYLKCVIVQHGLDSYVIMMNFIINMGVAALYSLLLWALLLYMSSAWAFPVPFYDVYTGPIMFPLMTFTAAFLLDRFFSGGLSSVAPTPPPLAQAAPSTKASPKLEDEHVVAATDVKRGTTDQAQFVDDESVVNGETVGAAEDVVDSNDDNDVEKGCVTRVDDPPNELDCDGELLEEKIEGSHASLDGVKLMLHGKIANDSHYRFFLAFFADGLSSSLVVIPLSSGLFHATSGYWQNVAVLGLSWVRLGYRWGMKRSSKRWLQPSVRFFFIFIAGFVIDLMYEFHCALLFGSYDSAVSMMIPPVVDLLDNIWEIRKCIKEKNMLAREELIVLIVAKELAELISSIGTLIIFPIIWSTNRRSFFLIDEIGPENFKRGMIGLGVDLINEIVVLVVFSRILATRFQVKLPNLILSITETVGKTTMFVLVAASSTYISSFMMYHYGGDASFKFEWLKVGNFADVCEERQSELRSCYA